LLAFLGLAIWAYSTASRRRILFFSSGLFFRWFVFIAVVAAARFIRATIIFRFTLVNNVKIVLECEGHNIVLEYVAQLEILVHLISHLVFFVLVVAATLVFLLILLNVDALEEVEEGIALDHHRLLFSAFALLFLGMGHVAVWQPCNGGAHAAVNHVLLAHIEGLS